jgi:hypothetical protein
MAHVSNLRFNHLSLLRSRIEQKLIHLVRADVAQDSAVLFRIPEPLWPPRTSARVAVSLSDLVRSDINCLNDFADGALLNELARINRCFHLKPLAIHDAVDALRLGDSLAHFGKLLKGRDAWLVG